MRTFCGQAGRGSSVLTSARFGAKSVEFFEISSVYVEGGIEPVRTFCGQERGRSSFFDFVRTSFMDGPLA